MIGDSRRNMLPPSTPFFEVEQDRDSQELEYTNKKKNINSVPGLQASGDRWKPPGEGGGPRFELLDRADGAALELPRAQEPQGSAVKNSTDDYINYLKQMSHLSATALKKHMKQTHPKKIHGDEYANWSICEDMSSLSNFNCCVKRRITKVQKSLGIGPSLYLLSLKSYIKLFTLISIIAVPKCLILSSGNHADGEDVGGGIAELFSRVSLGNIGLQSDVTCGQTNVAQDFTKGATQKLSIECPIGKLSKIVALGLSREVDQQICQSDKIKNSKVLISKDSKEVYQPDDKVLEGLDRKSLEMTNNYIDLDPECSSYLSAGLQESEAVKLISVTFDEQCKGEVSCDI